ncbi:MAG: histidine kinase, partial [Actinomycetota bacterium]|nr:histidine kinase [Actinomycetota bacterium]
EPRGSLAAVPLVFAGVWLLPRRTKTGAALVITAALLSALAGASWGNIDTVVPLAVATFALGRAGERRGYGIAGVLAAAVASSLREGLELHKLVITVVMYGVTWVFGVVVRKRAVDALDAVARAWALAAQDPTVAASRRAVDERSRLADDALFALRSAVIGMRTTAREAAVGLDAHTIRAVHDRGTAAVEELRSLLGLLREPERPTATELSPETDAGTAPWRRAVPALWCFGLTAASAVAIALPPGDPNHLLPGAAAYATAAWLVATRPSRTAVAALAVLVVAGVGVSTHYGARGIGFVLFVFGAAVLAGLAWGERDRILRAAREEEAVLRARLSEAVAAATRAERLRLARELHDVASHAVGAMVLQAGAASALRPRDPAAAREALRTVEAMGDDALREVDEMLAALDAGEFGEAARAYAEPGRLATALEDLVAAMRARGLRVRARLGELPRSPALTATTYRVAHEGLANAMRHAPGAQVELVVERGDDGYVVRVSDDGPGTSDLRGAGFGLDGLSERVAACEGSFRAGPGAQGGFLVEAVLPVSALREVRG